MIENKIYVVYTPKPIAQYMDELSGVFIIPSGLHLAPYPMANDEIKFTGTFLECNIILSALLHYNLN